MKIVYIAHPISGDIPGNLERIRQIVRFINLNEPDTVPFAPYWLDCHALDDDNPEERQRGIRNDVALIEAGFIDEMRLYGTRISNGMRHEVELAESLGIPIMPMTEGTKVAYLDHSQKHNGDMDCGNCHKCLEGVLVDEMAIPIPVTATRMILCPVCGNKRCPKASDHNLNCTDSNEPAQHGSIF